MRYRAVLLVVLAALVVAAPAGAAVRVTLTASTDTPKAGEPWRWTVTARDGDRGVPARLQLKLLLGNVVVGCWKGGAMAQCSGMAAGDPISFRGKRSGVIRWPAASVGVPLTFQAVVTVGKRTLRLRTPVRVKAAAG